MGQDLPELLLRFKGLKTAPNPFSQAEPGGCEVADNVVFLGPDLVGPRRGFTATGSAGATLTRTAAYQSAIVAAAIDGAMRYYSGTTWSSLATSGTASSVVAPPDGTAPIRFASANKNLYATTSQGLLRLDGLAGAWKYGGTAPALSIEPTEDSGGTWLAAGSTTSYRVVLMNFDANGNAVYSAPSDIVSFTATDIIDGSGVQLFIRLPPYWVTTSTYVLTYRAFSTTSGSPLPEFFLIDQRQPSAPQVLGAQITIFDYTPDSALNTSYPLYTNPNSGVGEEHSNDLPPLARDIAFYKGRMFYANTTGKHRLSFQLLGTGTNSLSIGDVVTIAGVDFTGASTADTFNRNFQVYTSGSASQNTEDTARSLASVFNSWFFDQVNHPYTHNQLWKLSYVSGYTDPPGLLELEELLIGGTGATVSVSAHSNAWSLGTGATVSDVCPARIHWSENGLPEAVPLDNFEDIAATDKAIDRIVATQDALWIFKQDGLYRLTGDDPNNWTILPFDTQSVLQAPESAQPSKSAVFCMLTKGPSVVTSAGVEPIGSDIRRDLRELRARCSASVSAKAFGIVYATEGRYILPLPVSTGDAGSSQQYVFDVDELGWTRWTVANTAHGLVDPATDKLVLAVGDKLWVENKTSTNADMNDNGAAIVSTVKFLPVLGEDPLHLKNWRDVYFAFQRADFPDCSVSLETEANSIATAYTQDGPPYATWGGFAWGAVPWGQASRNFIVHQDVPAEYSLSTLLGLTLSVAALNADWQLQGAKVIYEPTSQFPVR
jgi:hypothetical protein